MIVGAIADELLAGTHAEKEVKAILNGISLAQAAVWADCVKAVDLGTHTYKEDHDHHPECAPFETAADEAAMIAFVDRDAKSCQPEPGEAPCHKQHHATDISIHHHEYKATYEGANPNDVTAAITAAIAVLKGEAAPARFPFNDKREALLALVHYVGDIHQPLHVGAVYLAPDGKRVIPDGHFDAATVTRGGNDISVVGADQNLHAIWDATPDVKPDDVNTAWLNDARAVAPTTGPLTLWSSTWASDTQKRAVTALGALKFKAKFGDDKHKWSTTLSTAYAKAMKATKKTQLTKAGARLAQLLTKIWPG